MFIQDKMKETIEEIWGYPNYFEQQDQKQAEHKKTVGQALAQAAYEAQQQRKHYERIEKENLDKLKLLSEGKTSEYGEFMFVKTMRAGSINYAAIPELMEISLDQYRKADVESWSLIKK